MKQHQLLTLAGTGRYLVFYSLDNILVLSVFRHYWNGLVIVLIHPGHRVVLSMKVKSESEVTQSCPTLGDPMDYRLPGSSIHGIFQAKVLEWVAIAFSDGKLEMLINMVDCTPVFTVHHLHLCPLLCELQSLFLFFFFLWEAKDPLAT